MIILFFRHGETILNAYGGAPGAFQGHSDSKLTPEGENHAKLIGEVINIYSKDLKVSKIFRSPLPRVKQTALIALGGKYDDEKIIISDNLREICFGDWEEHKREDLPKEILEQRERKRYTFKYPGKYKKDGVEGESYEIQFDRVKFFIEKELRIETLDFTKDEMIIVFGHNGILTNAYRYFTNTPIHEMHPIRFANFEFLIYDGKELVKKNAFDFDRTKV